MPTKTMQQDQLIKYISEGNFQQVRESIITKNEVDIADLFEVLPIDKCIIVFRLLPKELAADVFAYMSSDQQQLIIEGIADGELNAILKELFMDDTVDLLEEMPASVVKRILRNVDDATRKTINQLLIYPEDSAGSIMTTEYLDLKKEMTIGQAIAHIKKTGINKETLDVCYIIDHSKHLEGIITLRDLVLGDDQDTLEAVMDENYIAITTNTDQEAIASLFRRYDLIAMPVVDQENRLVGIITIDDVVDIIELENTEDFHKMAAMSPMDEPYLKTKTLTLAKSRVVWLLVLMISATLTGSIIRQFEDVLQSVVILAAFIPMLMDTGGNAGSQSATLVIRGMALDEIKKEDTLKVLWKEFKVSLMVGFTLAFVNFLRISFIERTDMMIALVVCISLFLTVVLAKVVGCTLPIAAKQLKLDPAIMASPLITTIVDAVALVAYFSLAVWLLGIA